MFQVGLAVSLHKNVLKQNNFARGPYTFLQGSGAKKLKLRHLPHCTSVQLSTSWQYVLMFTMIVSWHFVSSIGHSTVSQPGWRYCKNVHNICTNLVPSTLQSSCLHLALPADWCAVCQVVVTRKSRLNEDFSCSSSRRRPNAKRLLYHPRNGGRRLCLVLTA